MLLNLPYLWHLSLRTKECQNKIDISHLTEMTVSEAITQYEEKIEEDKK